MSNSRRQFLKAGTLATLFAALPFKSILAQTWKDRDGNPTSTPPVQSDPLANYSKATFKSYLNSIFQLHTVTGIVEVTLLQVNDMPAPKDGECFTLLFRGGARAQRQDTYTLVHASLGTFRLLLVPIGTDQNGAQGYLATINRLSPADAANMSPPGRQSRTVPSAPASAPAATPTPAPGPNPSPTTPVVTPITPPTAPAAPVRKRGNRRKRKPSWKRTDSQYSIGIER